MRGSRQCTNELGWDATKGELTRGLINEASGEDETRDDETDDWTETNWG